MKNKPRRGGGNQTKTMAAEVLSLQGRLTTFIEFWLYLSNFI